MWGRIRSSRWIARTLRMLRELLMVIEATHKLSMFMFLFYHMWGNISLLVSFVSFYWFDYDDIINAIWWHSIINCVEANVSNKEWMRITQKVHYYELWVRLVINFILAKKQWFWYFFTKSSSILKFEIEALCHSKMHFRLRKLASLENQFKMYYTIIFFDDDWLLLANHIFCQKQNGYLHTYISRSTKLFCA